MGAAAPVVASAWRTAPAASRMPAPQTHWLQLDPTGNGLALDLRMSRSWPAVRFGATDNISDATPLTCGAAKLVPAIRTVESTVGPMSPALDSVRISYGLPKAVEPPGAIRSTRRPKFE